ncbi:DUF4442 domain-containing protein [Putridiphycobacter roseus]|uniref:DUF4442 domain-containing protein n=1 Tax=Putridiphycobacter roseus TaxID=2219161 RepID=A0A2W1N8Y7_9FLAO|nr:DUF4442 domain-containing protein [Putridiphycobacter roseus]PZE15715.1 DUF4442 domain-containing protein [Putridiphycobacter roseus]
MNVSKYVNDAKKSDFGLRKLNFILGFTIPFNKPHGIKISELEDYAIKASIPYKRKNLNHIKGIHACALATTSEFASGFLLMTQLDFSKYRLIMEEIIMTYHYQAKKACIAKSELSADWFQNNILNPLENQNKISIINLVETYDTAGNHICTAKVKWQIKSWTKVKTKV